MSIAQRLVNFSDGLSADGVLSAAKGGTGNTTGGGTTSPTISQIGYGGDDTATDVAGGGLITLTGTNFASGAKVLINTTPVSVVTVVSSTQITFTAPALSAGSYILYVVNLDGSTAIAVPGIQYSGVPAWSTAAGSLGTVYETGAISSTLSATSNSAVTYSVFSGTLPSGATLNSNGTISGTSPLVSGSTTYTFTVRATDGELQDTDRQFSLTINPDVVTWSSSNTVTLAQDALSTATLLATSAAGQTVSYATDTLPTGLNLSNGVVSGTPTVAGTTTTTATATAAVTGKTAQQTITWTVSVAADANWRYTTLLLNSENTTLPFATDVSANNFAVTVVGDTKPSNFNPYTPGYYSNYWDGTGDSLVVTGNGSVVNFGTGDFTIETWFYANTLSPQFLILDTCPGGVVSPTNRIYLDVTSDGTIRYVTFQGATVLITSGAGAVKAAQWAHVALVKSSNQTKLYLNGTQVGSTYADTLNYPAQTNRPILCANGYDGVSYGTTGYLSNFRIVKGTAVYTTNFTPSTTPLTAVANTSLLTCQSNRLVDLSTNAYTMTKTGDVAVSAFDPFTPNTSYSTYGSTYFDGTGDYLSVGDQTAFEFGSGDYTIELWWFATTSADQNLIGKWDGAGSEWVLQWRNAGYFRWAMGGNVISDATVSLPLNIWNHIVVSKSGTSLRIFLNGTQINTTATEGTIAATGASLTIATAQLNSSPLYTTGYISDLRIIKGTAVYTAAFTPPVQPLTAITNTSLLTCQTNQPHNNSQFIDSSTLGGVVTRFGNTTQGSFSPYGANWSNYFSPGQSNYIQTTIQAMTADFTVECWVYVTSVPNNGAIIGQTWEIWINTSGQVVYYTPASARITTSLTVPLNTWTHIALVRNAGVAKIYINGVADAATYTNSGTVGSLETTYIARDPGSVGGYNGYISNLRIVNGTAVYTSTFTPPTAPLTPIANTSLLTCQSQSFVDNSPNRYAVTLTGTPSTQKFSPFATVTQTPRSHSVYFDGTGDALTFTGSPGTTLSGNFTIEAWVHLNSVSINQPIICIGDDLSNPGVLFFINTTAKLGIAYANTTAFAGTGTVTANTWAHVAFVRSGTTITAYLNGVSQGTLTTSNTFSGTTSYIGKEQYNGGTGAQTSGYISNLRIVNGTALYTANFTPPTSPLTAVSGTSLLTCQSATIRDNSINNFALTVAGNTTPRAFNPFGYTTSNSQDYSPQTFGGSMYFDNSGDYLALPTSNTYLIGSGDFTIECWVYKRSTTFDTILSYSSGSGLRIFVNSTGGLELWLGASQQWSVGGVVSNNHWNHIAFVRSGTTLTGYVNGVNVGTATNSTNYNAGTLNIGGEGTGSPWGGYISDFRIIRGQALYTSNFVPPVTPLTASTNTMLLINGDRSAIADKSGKVVAETVGDARVSTAVKKYGTSSMFFDGTGDYLYAPTSDVNNLSKFLTGNFTVECWIYPTTSSGDRTIICAVYSWGNGANYCIELRSGLLLVQLGDAITMTSGTTAISANTWTHIALVRSSATSTTFYVNGISVATSSSNWTANEDCPLTIGCFNANGGGLTNYYQGYIDDLRITKGYARYTTNFTPPSSALLTK